MGYPALHRPHSITLPGSSGLITLSQFQSFGVNKQFSVYRARAAAAAVSQWSGVDEGNPEAQFATLDVGKVLTHACSAMGEQAICVGYDPVVNTGTVSLYYRKGKKRGMRYAAADNVHDRFDLVNNAMFFWRSLQAQQGKNNRASIECSLKAVSNDGLNPLTYVGTSACVGTEAVPSLFVLGPIKLNTVLVNSVASLRVDNQVQSKDQGNAGNPYPEYSDVEQAEPLATIESADLTLEATYAEPVALTSWAFYLRALKKNGLPYPDASAQHIKISGTVGMAVVAQVQNVPSQMTLQVTLDKVDDATPAYTVATGVAIV